MPEHIDVMLYRTLPYALTPRRRQRSASGKAHDEGRIIEDFDARERSAISRPDTSMD
jgi:hypothetical protein